MVVLRNFLKPLAIVTSLFVTPAHAESVTPKTISSTDVANFLIENSPTDPMKIFNRNSMPLNPFTECISNLHTRGDPIVAEAIKSYFQEYNPETLKNAADKSHIACRDELEKTIYEKEGQPFASGQEHGNASLATIIPFDGPRELRQLFEVYTDIPTDELHEHITTTLEKSDAANFTNRVGKEGFIALRQLITPTQ